LVSPNKFDYSPAIIREPAWSAPGSVEGFDSSNFMMQIYTEQTFKHEANAIFRDFYRQLVPWSKRQFLYGFFANLFATTQFENRVISSAMQPKDEC
jgi:hypothetical protein